MKDGHRTLALRPDRDRAALADRLRADGAGGLRLPARRNRAGRHAHRPPRWPDALPQWQRRAAELAHRALYVCMVVMPLSGYVASNFSKHGVKFFGTTLAPWGADLPQVYGFFNGVHIVTAYVF